MIKNPEIVIYNLKEQELRTFSNLQFIQFAQGGQVTNQSIHWNVRDDNDKAAASGIYLYRLLTDSISVTSKMVLFIRIYNR
jgi:hypothetical protein